MKAISDSDIGSWKCAVTTADGHMVYPGGGGGYIYILQQEPHFHRQKLPH